MRYNMLAIAVAASLGLAGLVATNPAHAAGQSAAVTDAQLQQLQAQVAALQAQLDALQDRTDAQSNINTATAQDVEEAQATKAKVDKLEKLVNDTKIGGKMYFDVTHISETSNGVDTNKTGTGIDVKRFYLSVDHQFDETWSANLTTDFQYNSALDSAADIYVKKAYVEGKFSDAFKVRAGSADLPWVPFAEGFYGFRYVENVLIDRLKFGTSADWGVHASGDLGDAKLFNYAVSVINGAGYKTHTRSKGVDVEGRLAFTPLPGLAVAVGGYSGKLGKETQNTNALHTANRTDFLVAYSNDRFGIGGEYFRAKDWNNVLSPLSDTASGYSLWGNVGLGKSAVLFARYDQADLSKDLDPSLTDKYFNVGVQFEVRKGFKLAAVYKNDKRDNDTNVDLKTDEVGVWGEVKF